MYTGRHIPGCTSGYVHREAYIPGCTSGVYIGCIYQGVPQGCTMVVYTRVYLGGVYPGVYRGYTQGGVSPGVKEAQRGAKRRLPRAALTRFTVGQQIPPRASFPVSLLADSSRSREAAPESRPLPVSLLADSSGMLGIVSLGICRVPHPGICLLPASQ